MNTPNEDEIDYLLRKVDEKWNDYNIFVAKQQLESLAYHWFRKEKYNKEVE